MRRFAHEVLQPLNQMLADNACDVHVKYFIDMAPYVKLSQVDSTNLLNVYENVKNCCPMCYETLRQLNAERSKCESLYARLETQRQLFDQISAKDSYFGQLLSLTGVTSATFGLNSVEQMLADPGVVASSVSARDKIGGSNSADSMPFGTYSAAQPATGEENGIKGAIQLITRLSSLQSAWALDIQKHAAHINEVMRHASEIQSKCAVLSEKVSYAVQFSKIASSKRETAEEIAVRISQQHEKLLYQASRRQVEDLEAENGRLRETIYQQNERLERAAAQEDALLALSRREIADAHAQYENLLKKSQSKSYRIEILQSNIRRLESELAQISLATQQSQPLKAELVIKEPRAKSNVAALQKAQLMKIQVGNLKKYLSALRQHAQQLGSPSTEQLAREILACVVAYCLRK